MKFAIRFLKRAIPFIRLGAAELEDLDDNTSGNDDRIARAVNYGGDVIEAVIDQQPIPFPPLDLFSAQQLAELKREIDKRAA